MSIRPLLISALALSMSFRPCLSQEVHPRSAGISCDPCAIQFDTVAVIRSTPSTQITGTTFFERVGPYFVVADLLDGTRVRIFSSAGSLIGDLLGSDGVREFGQVQALRAVGEDSLAVFDAALKKLSILDISSGSGEEIDLPMAVSPGGGLVQDGLIVLAPALSVTRRRVTISGAGEVREVPMAPRTGSDSARFERIRLLGRGHEGTFWLLHFLAYRAQQYDLETGELLQEIDREPSWMAKSSSSGSADWRYASLLAAFQPARDRLWILGRSNEPEYSPGALSDPTAPLAGRESVWDLQLELLSLPEGELLASITLPHWIGGFTTDGMLFFFDELESDWGQIVVVRLSLGEDQPRAK